MLLAIFPRTNVSFAPRLVPTLAALLALMLTLYLGNWQQGRAAEKRGLQAEYDARANLPQLALATTAKVDDDASFRNAIAQGEFDAQGQFFIDNKSDGMVVGYHVIVPFRLVDTNRYVLVNRGFVPRAKNYPIPPIVHVPTGPTVVTGMLVVPTAKFLELGRDAKSAIDGNVWQNLTIQRYRDKTSRDVVPLVLLADPTSADLKAQTERPDARVEKHIEYMLTWYSLAATVIILWLALSLQFTKRTTAA